MVKGIIQKILNYSIFFVCLAASTAILSFIYLLMNMGRVIDIDLDLLTEGHILHVFTSTEFWMNFPAIIPFHYMYIMVDFRAFLLTVPVMAYIYYLMRHKKRFSLHTTGLACLAIGLIPYFSGMLVLTRNTDPSWCGPWLATMVIGMFYAIIACMTLTGIEIFKPVNAKDTI